MDFISVDQNGHIDLDELKNKIRDDTILISIMYVNNEIGSIQPIDKIRELILNMNTKIKLHVDMVQALGKIPVDLSLVDMASFSAHKIYGLKAVSYTHLVIKVLSMLVFMGYLLVNIFKRNNNKSN